MRKSKLQQAAEILLALGLPREQQNERSVLTLLALANVKKNDSWRTAGQPLLRVWDIMSFIRRQYGKDYAANTRETIRRRTIHQFEQARIVNRNPDDPTRPTNSGRTVYCLTAEALAAIRVYGSGQFEQAARQFLQTFGSLQEAYQAARSAECVPLRLPDDSIVLLSPGAHNKLQVAIIEAFGPRFAPGAAVLYVGDTAQKHVVIASEKLAQLNVPITQHDKLPDVILYCAARNWLFLVEAVTAHGPISAKRRHEIEGMLSRCTAQRIYVTAFPDMATFRKYAADIAWETEVWVADNPGHMIHFNGPKFLGPPKCE